MYEDTDYSRYGVQENKIFCVDYTQRVHPPTALAVVGF